MVGTTKYYQLVFCIPQEGNAPFIRYFLIPDMESSCESGRWGMVRLIIYEIAHSIDSAVLGYDYQKVIYGTSSLWKLATCP